jgi:hypothetical protein
MVNDMSDNVATKIAQILSQFDGVAADKALAACPFRTFIAPGPLAGIGIEAMTAHVGGVFLLLEFEPGPVDPDVMDEIQTTLRAGKAVLLLARAHEVRDHARREILAWYDAVKGPVQ